MSWSQTHQRRPRQGAGGGACGGVPELAQLIKARKNYMQKGQFRLMTCFASNRSYGLAACNRQQIHRELPVR